METKALDVKKLREQREQHPLSQVELGKKLGLTQTVISQWENAKSVPSASQLKQLVAILGPDLLEDAPAEASPIAAWVIKTRIQKNFSVPQLAVQSGLTAPAIYRIESGLTRNLRPTTRKKLEKVLGPIPREMEQAAKAEASVKGLGSLEDFDPYNQDERPSEPGIYVLYDISERPIYVGQGANVRKRLQDHDDKFWFKPPIVQAASWIKVEDLTLRQQIEEILIKFLKSNAILNKQHVDRS